MRWILEKSTPTANYWALMYDKLLVELKYNKTSHAFRIKGSERRLFFLEQTGFFQKKIQLKTEYGVVAAENYFIKNWKNGVVNLEGNKFRYDTRHEKISIVNKSKKLATQTTVERLDSLDSYEFSALLFALTRFGAYGYKKPTHELLNA